MRLPATANGRVSLPALLDELGRRNLLSVLVEGGAEVHASFFADHLVDKVHAYVAPASDRRPRSAGSRRRAAGSSDLADAISLRDVDFTRLGDDMLITAYVRCSPG